MISRFVKAFDAPDSAENLDFLGKVVHREGGGSSPSYLCGWITAFCVFDEAGKWLGRNIVIPDETAMPLNFFFTILHLPANLLPSEARTSISLER